MPYQFTLYDAFSGINAMEKSKVIRFLCDHNLTPRHSVLEAVEYAVKLKPSFGGYVLVAEEDHQIIGAVVANRTGMEGYNPKNIFVFVTLHKDYEAEENLIRALLEKAIRYADGDVAIHVEPGHPALQIYQKMGFQAQYLELRLSKHKSAVA